MNTKIFVNDLNKKTEGIWKIQPVMISCGSLEVPFCWILWGLKKIYIYSVCHDKVILTCAFKILCNSIDERSCHSNYTI